MTKAISLLFLSCLTIQFSVSAQNDISQVEFSRFVKDIAITESNPNHLRMAMWFPGAYWDLVGHSSPSFTPQMVKDVKEMLKDYVIVCVVEAKVNRETLEFEPLSEKELRKN